YRVIVWNIYGDEYLRETYTTDERKQLSKYFNNNEYGAVQWDYYKRTTKDAISVSGYSYMYSFSETSSREEFDIENNSTVPVSINIQDLQKVEEVWEVDVRELVQLIISRGSNSDYNDGTLPYEIQMDGGKKCVVSYISFSYNETDGTIKYLDLKGYILW
ncbi:MAG: hypothetical protein K2H07_01945, partial [Lachnospiraceae bacterium]|nr:hypothetical protein [Lachnospiraceae bacterium]